MWTHSSPPPHTHERRSTLAIDYSNHCMIYLALDNRMSRFHFIRDAVSRHEFVSSIHLEFGLRKIWLLKIPFLLPKKCGITFFCFRTQLFT